jgi:hypothetical protein
MEQDPRVIYISSVAAAMFGNPSMSQSLAADPNIGQFVNELTNKVLQIMSDGQKFRIFLNQVAPPGNFLECHFVRRPLEELTE